jgi:hypothetical protein
LLGGLEEIERGGNAIGAKIESGVMPTALKSLAEF